MQKWQLIAGGLVLAFIVYWALTPNQPTPAVHNTTIVWLGDSIGSGYGTTPGNTPADYLSRKLGLPVINESTSGDKTVDGVAKIPQVLAHDPGLVIMQLSGNDAIQKVAETETEANLRTMTEAFQAEGVVVLMVGVRSGPFSNRYGDMFDELEEEYDLLYLPDALKGLFGDTRYMADPIHPNDAGSEILAERVYELIQPIYE